VSDPTELAAQWAAAWTAAWTAHDATRLANLFTEDCVHTDVTLGVLNHGREHVAEFAAAYFGPMPDLAITVDWAVANGDRIAAEWTMTGTQTGDLPSGVPASGRSFTLRGASTFEVRGDLLHRGTDYWDRLTLLRQLGHAD
jgi:steroid delta-isomerase-like uncharacterized protein